MPHGLVVMWLAIGSEFPGSNPGNSGNYYYFFFEFYFWKVPKTIMVSIQSPKISKAAKRQKKSYFNDLIYLIPTWIPMCWHIFYWQCITWQKIRLRGLCLLFFLKILIISMYLKSATSSNVNKNWQDMQCQIWRNSL